MTLQEAAKNDYELPSTFVQIDKAVEKKKRKKLNMKEDKLIKII